MGMQLMLSSMTATEHIVPQQTRPRPPLRCESSEGADRPARTTAQTVASPLDKDATASTCRTACFGDTAWTVDLVLAPCPGCATAGTAQASVSKTTSAAAFNPIASALARLTSFCRFFSSLDQGWAFPHGKVKRLQRCVR